MESSSFMGSSKRAKALGNIGQVAHCLVDGCNADLSLCRDYHRRHKVCEAHSKTAKVTIAGREQRFCQQCSRFHSLVEFDEGKRSCRKRLDGHNRRRRKPQPDSLARNSPLVFSSQQGATLLSFGATPQILPSSLVGSSWAGLMKPDNDTVLYNTNQHQQQLSYSRVHHQLPFLQGGECAPVQSEASICQPTICQPAVLDPSDGLNQVVESDRALSLLSSGPTATREFHSLQYSGLGPYQFGQESKPVVSTTGSNSSSMSSTLHFQEMFNPAPDGSSLASGSSHQTLTFIWE